MKKEIDIDELKLIQLEILQAIHDFCIKSNIKYSLAYGTLIGAIRHKGYIPWDDDVDIIMPRDDYERFIETFDGAYDCLIVLAPSKDENFYAPYANVVNTKTVLFESRSTSDPYLGIKIDIFPIDSVPESESERISLYKRVRFLKFLISINNARYSDFNSLFGKACGFFIKTLGNFISYSVILNRIAINTNVKNKDSRMVNNIVWCARDEKACFMQNDMEDYIDVFFEGRRFKSIAGYDSFLKAHYGDYMKLPPENQRIPHHGFTAYWKE